jgi:hypothetical protein
VHQAERRKLVFQSQASGDAGCDLWHIRGTSAKTPKKAKIEANALKHGSKVATTFQRCLIIKHLCNKPLAFESSASANSATPASREIETTNSRAKLKPFSPVVALLCEMRQSCWLPDWVRVDHGDDATALCRSRVNRAVARESREE